MEKIDPQGDHIELERFKLGAQVTFNGKRYTIERRTTLASGEAAVVLRNEGEQFVIAAKPFLAAVNT